MTKTSDPTTRLYQNITLLISNFARKYRIKEEMDTNFIHARTYKENHSASNYITHKFLLLTSTYIKWYALTYSTIVTNSIVWSNIREPFLLYWRNWQQDNVLQHARYTAFDKMKPETISSIDNRMNKVVLPGEWAGGASSSDVSSVEDWKLEWSS